MKNIYQLVECLINYGLKQAFIYDEDIVYMRNRLADFLQIDASLIVCHKHFEDVKIGDLLSAITDWAAQNDLIESANNPYDDLFETALMALLVPLPSTVSHQFWQHYHQSPRAATDWYYNFSKATDYIKTQRIARNVIWQHDTLYGTMTMAINLAKPEKDPKAIAAAAKIKHSNYPQCLLCEENIGFAGNLTHPARQTHRVIDVKLADENWFFQYSPYMYYDEHIIVIKRQHQPMLINRTTYQRLADFVDYFPHYFIGSNAGLPIVGGSLLNHDHYQGGNYQMPIFSAETYVDYGYRLFDEVQVSWLDWPMTTLHLRSANKKALVDACQHISEKWRAYTNRAAGLIAQTDQPHHAITPVMRKIDECYEVDLVLRSNLTSEQYPDGIYHPHPEIHPVKRENIGIIEVMGYAVLPGRLKQTIQDLADGLRQQVPFRQLPDSCRQFTAIYLALQNRYTAEQDATELVQKIIGDTFLEGLKHAAVIATDASGQPIMDDFIATL